jgi:hypothetical protein
MDMLTGVADPHHDGADLVPSFYFDADRTFHFDAGRDPDPDQSDVNLDHWHIDPLRLHFEHSRSPMAPF